MLRGVSIHLELILTLVGVAIVGIVAAALHAPDVLRWQAATATALTVGAIHGVLFWALRMRRHRARPPQRSSRPATHY